MKTKTSNQEKKEHELHLSEYNNFLQFVGRTYELIDPERVSDIIGNWDKKGTLLVIRKMQQEIAYLMKESDHFVAVSDIKSTHEGYFLKLESYLYNYHILFSKLHECKVLDRYIIDKGLLVKHLDYRINKIKEVNVNIFDAYKNAAVNWLNYVRKKSCENDFKIKDIISTESSKYNVQNMRDCFYDSTVKLLTHTFYTQGKLTFA